MATRIASVGWDQEMGKWMIHWYGDVWEQGGTREGYQTAWTDSLEGALEYLKAVALKYGEERYLEVINRRENE